MCKSVNYRLASLMVGILGMLAVTGWSLPSKMTVNGMLKDASGRPISQGLNWAVKFFGEATTATQVGPVLHGYTVVQDGVFSLELDVPEQLQALDEAWYELAFDTNGDFSDPLYATRSLTDISLGNWLDVADWFLDRFRITSLPYLLQGDPAPFFSTHGGVIPSMFNTKREENLSWLDVSPFLSPPNGVVFNRMSTLVYVGSEPGKCSFGIYDEQGNLVCQSDVVELPAQFENLVEVEVSGRLKPNKLYYTGFACNVWMGTARPPMPPVPGTGVIKGVIDGRAKLLSSFDPDEIEFDTKSGICIGLRYVE